MTKVSKKQKQSVSAEPAIDGNNVLAVVFIMYMLIKIGTNGSRRVELVSRTKKKLEDHIKEKGFYWSKKANRYIDDKTSGIDGGSGTDYLIHSVDELA